MDRYEYRTSRNSKNDDLLAFGYTLLEESEFKMKGMGHHKKIKQYIYQRDTYLENYPALRLKEDQYNALRDQILYYDEPSKPLTIFLFILFIIPGVIYLHHKKKEQETMLIRNPIIANQMKDIVEQAKMIEKK